VTALLVAALLAAGAPHAPALAARAREVAVRDYVYEPARLTVVKDTLIRWRWPAEPIDVHDVYLYKGPSGVKTFMSEPASSGYVFSHRLRRPGLYRIVCTLHEGMAMTIRVRR
jgi:plastocyanin